MLARRGLACQRHRPPAESSSSGRCWRRPLLHAAAASNHARHSHSSISTSSVFAAAASAASPQKQPRERRAAHQAACAARSSAAATTTASSMTTDRPSLAAANASPIAAAGDGDETDGPCAVTVIGELTGRAGEADALRAANALVAREFYPKPPPGAPRVADAVAFHTYRLRHAAQALALHAREGARGAHFTLLATPVAGSSSSSSCGASSSSSSGSSRKGGARGSGDDGDGAVGVCNVTLRRAGDEVAAAAGCEPGAPFAMVTNMTVLPEWRRRGVARRLLRAALAAAEARLGRRAHFVALLVYRGSEPAYGLYSSEGFVPTTWLDPIWARDAERSRVGARRRLLMVRPLLPYVKPPPLPPPPPPAAAAGSTLAAGADASAAGDAVV